MPAEQSSSAEERGGCLGAETKDVHHDNLPLMQKTCLLSGDISHGGAKRTSSPALRVQRQFIEIIKHSTEASYFIDAVAKFHLNKTALNAS